MNSSLSDTIFFHKVLNKYLLIKIYNNYRTEISFILSDSTSVSPTVFSDAISNLFLQTAGEI